MAGMVLMVKNGVDTTPIGMHGQASQPKRVDIAICPRNSHKMPPIRGIGKTSKDNGVSSNPASLRSIDHTIQPKYDSEDSLDNPTVKRCFGLQLPSFKSLSILHFDPALSVQNDGRASLCEIQDEMQQLRSSMLSHIDASLRGAMPLLTPPLDEMPVTKLRNQLYITQSSGNAHASTQSGEAVDSMDNPGLMTGMPQGRGISESLQPTDSSLLGMSSWVVRVSHIILNSLNANISRDSIHLVSQTLPSQAKGSDSRPTFEDVLEFLQVNMNTVPYITITHAVPQATVMEEVPKTPPSTPNLRQNANDYFSNDQTIFTHAAVVPNHHTHDRTQSGAAGKVAHHVAAPGSTQLSILERYIPPTRPEEVDDFFNLSGKSYLVDRLSELSADNGSLILIYPTLTGGETFTKRYVGPVIDPYLRQFIMLNSLTSDAAAIMGKMTAVANMIDFEEMERRITTLCKSLGARPVARGPRSTFTMTHSETASITLDRATWMNWYVEQEQPRLRQNLVEYHQSGGRMPASEGNREITVGMLARDFIDGFQKSQESAGAAEIEIGVFVITRSTVS